MRGEEQGLAVRAHLRHRARDGPRKFPLLSKSASWTALVCPLTVRSRSPVSQSQTLSVASSLAVTMTLKTGWKATLVTGLRWPVIVCRAGARGSQSGELADGRFVGADESSSVSCAFFVSRSMIYHAQTESAAVRPGSWLPAAERAPARARRTFFCSRITLVHFFSSKPVHLARGSG